MPLGFGRRWSREASDEAWARLSCGFDMIGPMEKDPLATYLDALERDECYRVDSVLKESPCEVTELVYFAGDNGAQLGPFVRKRILREAEMGQGYTHLWEAQRAGRRFLHLPRIYDVHHRDGEMVVVMEYVEGHTLREEVFQRDPSVDLAVEWFPLLCDGVSELHRLLPSPLIHRDLKPTNVLVGMGQLTVIDFGIARPYRDGAEEDTTHFGTRSYAPPEQFGYGQTDARSDVYALGMILYYLLTEHDPSPAVVRAGFPDAEIPAPLRAVLVRACAFDPAARYASAAQMKEAFSAACRTMRAAAVSVASKQEGGAADGCNESQGAAVEPAPVDGPRGASRASIAVGMVWNGALLLVWAFLMLACVVAVVNPNENDAQLPVLFLIMEYIGFVGLCATGIGYGLLDKRWLRRHVSFMQGQTFKTGLVVGAKLLAIGLGVLLLCIILAAAGAVTMPSAAS